jgi:hypothetical protein
MPAMIDLLIARGRLSESDRPCCVHWWAVKGPGPLSGEDIRKIVDADEMLRQAGIRTLMADWDLPIATKSGNLTQRRSRSGPLAHKLPISISTRGLVFRL